MIVVSFSVMIAGPLTVDPVTMSLRKMTLAVTVLAVVGSNRFRVVSDAAGVVVVISGVPTTGSGGVMAFTDQTVISISIPETERPNSFAYSSTKRASKLALCGFVACSSDSEIGISQPWPEYRM